MFETEIFLSVFNVCEDEVIVPIQSALCLFLIKYLQQPIKIAVSFVINDDDNTCHKSNLNIDIKGFSFKTISQKDLKRPISDCHLPVFSKNDGISCVAGLCAVLRQVIKHSGDEWRWMLGFREGCLAACAEVSLWTRFCEVDIVSMVEKIIAFQDNAIKETIEIPVDILRFEQHLNQEVRVHNIKKVLQNKNVEVLQHSFAESHQMSLADILIYPCVYILLHKIGSSSLKSSIPLVYKWYNLVSVQDHVLDSISILNLSAGLVNEANVSYIKPVVPAQSLYKSDPKRYKPRSKLFTRQENVEGILETMNSVIMPVDYSTFPFGYDLDLDWKSMPDDLYPSVPDSRLDRKIQQLENLAKAVLKIAQPGDAIVDFCSGSGHLGIGVAYCLPDCHIILLDNKEESLARAHTRVIQLGLRNVHIVQCNLDYFTGKFQIGMSLHACGVASDLVIKACLLQRAAFIVCPCCYGSLQDNHKVNYPQSKCLKELAITDQDFFVLGHCADQVHKLLYKKSEQGERCMAIVDFDRCLRAKEIGYNISLAKLVPPSCTPRNNLLVGIPK